MKSRFILVNLLFFVSMNCGATGKAAAQKPAGIDPISFQSYVSTLATRRFSSTEDAINLLKRSVFITDGFNATVNSTLTTLSQQHGFTFGGGENVDSISFDSTSKGELAYVVFNFNREGCVHIQQVESVLGKFSGYYAQPDQANIYAKQMALSNGVVYRVYMSHSSLIRKDCIIGFNVYIRGGYERWP